MNIFPPLVCGISSGTRWYRVPPSDDRTTREMLYMYMYIYLYLCIYTYLYTHLLCAAFHQGRDGIACRPATIAPRARLYIYIYVYVYVYISISMYIYIFIYPPLVCGISSGTRWYRVPPSEERTTREMPSTTTE